ncbi:MAG: glycosyltransferase family 4 protein [Bacteroidales bacterium]|jgi:glycosyltransferase involved in cell wall biosynthesis|nr:glycosyltransferase family 4 protein [Bacteroidales bacterium]
MKILFIVPGSGDPFYCGNCFRDNLHANALWKAGHEVIVMPLYLPLKHESFKGNTPLFFPAVSFYIAQKFFTRKSMPKWMENILNTRTALNIAASFSGSTSAEGMEGLTLSMIHGEGQAFNEQVKLLVNWIEKQEKPDIIHLSSSLVIGIAKAIKQKIDIPIICSLQDEEVWVDHLKEEYATIAWKGISDNLKYIDQFVASSEFYKGIALRRIPEIQNIEVVYPGINREKYASADYPENQIIGFFYRMNRENGLHILAEAFVKLKEKESIPNLKLKIGGGYTSVDKKFLKQVKKTLEPFMNDVIWSDSYSLDDHQQFYKGITALSVPLTFDEGVGLYLCEAFAAGRPAVEPATGSFPEIVGNAGVLYEPNDSQSLADALEKLLINETLLSQSKENALHLSATRYNDKISAEKLIEIYKNSSKICCIFGRNTKNCK